MTDDEAAIAIMEPCRKGTPADRLIDNLDWERLEMTINGVSLNDWSHSQEALVQIARAVWLHGSFNYRLFGLLDRSNRARVLAIIADHLDVVEAMPHALGMERHGWLSDSGLFYSDEMKISGQYEAVVPFLHPCWRSPHI